MRSNRNLYFEKETTENKEEEETTVNDMSF